MLEKIKIIQMVKHIISNTLHSKSVQAAYLFLFSLILPTLSYAEIEENTVEGKPALTTIWVVGDKDLVADAFNACAMLFGSGGIAGALLLSSVIVIGTMAFSTLIQRNMQVFNYVIIFVIVMALFSVKTTVYIASYYDLNPKTGRVQGSVIGATTGSYKAVGNVPVGIAWPLGVMSSVSQTISRQFNTALNNNESGYLIQGSEGYFSPLKTVLRLRNQWNTPENQYLMQNISAVMSKDSACGWKKNSDQLGKSGIRGLLTNSHPSGAEVSIVIPEINPTTGEVLSAETHRVDCALAGLVINAQMLQSVVTLQGKEYSQLAESMAKSRHLSLTASGTKSQYQNSVKETQAEVDKVPNLVVRKMNGGGYTNNVGITIQDTNQFLTQIRTMAAAQSGNRLTYKDAEDKNIIPSTMIVGNATTVSNINAAEIQANMIYGNLLLNCLSGDPTCTRYDMLMTDARSRANLDSAGNASMYAHYMHYGMNILMFIYVVMSPIILIVIVAMGVQGWRLIKSYLLFAVWINSWLPATIAIAYYQLRGYETAIEKLVSSLSHDAGLIYSPVVMNNILNASQDTIASASNFMASVPLLMMALLSGSIYGLTQLAQKAVMSGKDYINEGAVVQSPDDPNSYNGQIAQMMMRSTGGNATSANASYLTLGTKQGDHTAFKLFAGTQMAEQAKSSISSKIDALESITNTGTWTHADSYSEAVDKGILIGTSQNGEKAISFNQGSSHDVNQVDTSKANWALSLDAKGNVVSLPNDKGGVSVGASAGYGKEDSVGQTVQITHQNGQTETLREGMQIARTDTITGNFGTITGEEFMQAQSQQLSHQKAQLSAIETAQTQSSGGEISVNFDNALYNHAVSHPAMAEVRNDALVKAGEYSKDFEQDIMRSGNNMAKELQIAKDALVSNDISKVQAAGAYLSHIFDHSGIDGGHGIADQIDGYTATKASNFDGHIRQEINQDISAHNAERMGDFKDDTISQKGNQVHQDIETGKVSVGAEAGRLKFAQEHNGYSHEQVAQLRELNNQEIIEQAKSYMARLEDIHSNKMQKQDYGASDEFFEGAKYLWNKEDASLLDKSVAVLGFAAGAFEWGLSKVPFVNDMNKHVLASADEENWKEAIADGQKQGLSIQEMLESERFTSQIKNAKEHLGDQPLTDEIAKQVGEPKYGDELAKLDKATDTPPPAEEKSFGDKALEVAGEVAESAIKGVLGISEAHAADMPPEHFQQTNKEQTENKPFNPLDYDPRTDNWSRTGDAWKQVKDDTLNKENAEKKYNLPVDKWLAEHKDWQEKHSDWRLGVTSKKYEVGNRGVGTISSGEGDKGGKSYGLYQISTAPNGGTIPSYLKSSAYKKEFDGLTVNSKEFQAKWKEIAKRDPDGFAKDQHDFIERTHYKPLLKQLDKMGIDLENRSPAIQDAIWSTSVQYPPRLAKSIFKDSLAGQDINKLTDAEIIKKVYDYKHANVHKHFDGSSKKTQASVRQRTIDEPKDLLKLCD